jgi:putative transposase
MTSKATNKLSPEVRECAVLLVKDHDTEHPSRWAAIVSVSSKFGCTAQTLHQWLGKAERDGGRKPGLTTDAVARLKGAGAREPRASTSQRNPAQSQRLFHTGGARPPIQAMIAFVKDHRQVYGVEPICKVLPIAPSTFHAHVAKRADLAKLSARTRQHIALTPEIARVFAENFEAYGVRKVSRQMMRERFDVAHCTVKWLMRGMGPRGVIRGKQVRTQRAVGVRLHQR